MGLRDIFTSQKTIQERIDTAVAEGLKKSLKDNTRLRSIFDPNRAFQEKKFEPAERREFLELYETYVWVYACVFAINTNGAKVPFRIFKRKPNGEKGDEVLSGWPWTLFNRPNPLQSNFDFNEALISSLELTGSAFIEKDNPTRPEQMYVMRPDFIEVIGSRSNLVDKIIYDVNGSVAEFEPEDIVNFKYYHPRSEIYGLSPVMPATNSIVLDLFSITYSKNFFKNGGQLSMYLKVKNELNDEEHERLREEVRTMYGGVDRAHLIGVLDNDAEFKEVGNSPANALLKEQRLMNRDEIMAIYGVPPIMMGLVSDITYNNGLEQEKGFWQNKMQPTLRKVSDKWNVDFLERNGFIGEYDFSDIAALQEDMEKKSNIATRLVKEGVFTPNEARKKFYQLEELAGGDALRVPGFAGIAGGLAATRGILTPNETREQYHGLKDHKDGKDLRKPAEEKGGDVEKFLKEHSPGHRFNQFFGSRSRRIETKLESLMRDFEKQVISNIARLQKSEILIQKDMITESVQNLDELEATLLTLMQEENLDAGIDFFKAKYLELSGGVVPEEVLVNVTSQLESQIAQWANNAKVQITRTMRTDLQKALEISIRDGEDVDEITKRIQEVFRGTDRAEVSRARRIAKTEMLKIGNHSNTVAAQTLGFTKKIWVADGPPDDRGNHTGINGEEQPIDGTFSIGLRFPGDPNASAAQTVNCACTLDYA